MAEIELTETIKQAIKRAGENIEIVDVNEEWPSTTGLFQSLLLRG